MEPTSIASSIGLLFGLLLTVASWSGKIRTGAGKDDLRVRAAAYGLGAMFLTMVTDWKRFQQKDTPPLDFTALALHYAGGFALGMGVALLALSIGVVMTSRQRAQQSGNEYAKQYALGVMEFITHGYESYLSKLEDSETKLLKDIGAADRRIIDSMAHANSYLAAIVNKLNLYLAAPTEQQRIKLCEDILDAITVLSLPFLTNGNSGIKVNANYMLAVPIAEATEEEKASARFTDGSVDSYAYLLVLKEYARDTLNAPHPFALPVAKSAKGVLPGAPEAFMFSRYVAVSVSETVFDKSVPRAVQKEILDFFKAQEYKCFVSMQIPIRRGGHVLGVVNVEATDDSLVRGRNAEKDLGTMGKLLQPYCALLGITLAYRK
jgi:hypothetical protein